MDPRIFRSFLDQIPQFILQSSQLAQQEEQAALDRQQRATEVRENQQFRAIESKKQRDFTAERDLARTKQEDKILIGENLGSREFGSFLLADDDPANDELALSYLARADQEDTDKLLSRIEKAAAHDDPATRIAALSAIEIPDGDFSNQIGELIKASQGEVDREAADEQRVINNSRIRQLQSIKGAEFREEVFFSEDVSKAFDAELTNLLQLYGPPTQPRGSKPFQNRFDQLSQEGKSKEEAFRIMLAEGFKPVSR